MTRTSEEVPQRQHNEDRMRRAWSWLKRSEKVAHKRKRAKLAARQEGFDDEEFIFLWIAFNAAYGHNIQSAYERGKFNNFLEEIVRRDEKRSVYNILWKTYPGPIRVLLNNRYVFKNFWESIQTTGNEGWREEFRRGKRYAANRLARGDVLGVLSIVFDRLYVLRNQILHGGATFAEGWGRNQVRDGSRVMASLVPAILEIMQADIDKNPDSCVWGKVAYPRVNEDKE